MYFNKEISDVTFMHYDTIRDEIVIRYTQYKDTKLNNESIHYLDINKQFVRVVQDYVTMYLAKVTNPEVSLLDIKLYVQDKFTFDNIQRIISQDGYI